MKVRFSQEAIRYVERERAYLAQFGRRTSVAFSDQIKKASRLIGNYPHVGVVVAPAEGVRRFVSAPYHLDYVVQVDRIMIISVMHARQGPADLEKDDDDAFD
jgi:plasmid stabilization system protein ParE